MAVAGCVSLCMSSWAHSPTLKRSDQQTAALGCQHSTLISLWWIEWKTCLILFFLLVPAPIDLRQHWNQYRIALLHSIGSRHTFCFDKKSTPQHQLRRRRVIIESVRAYVLNEVYRVSCIFVPYVGMWKLTVYFFFLLFFVGIGLSYVCVGLQMFRCDIQAGGRWWDTLPYCCVGV